MKHKNIFVLEGAHRVGKTTLLNELHDPSNGVINLYSHGIWESTKDAQNIVADSDAYNSQFVNSLKSQIYFIEMLLSTDTFHTIFIDRWYLTSLLFSIKSFSYEKDFGDLDSVFEYVNTIEDYLHSKFNIHTIVFKTDSDTLKKLDYDYQKNLFDSRVLNILTPFLGHLKNKHEIILKKVDGIFDIKEHLTRFVESKTK